MSKHIVFAWELGAGYGHIAGFAPMAAELHRRGHRVSWVVRDLANLHRLKLPAETLQLQAPIALPRPGTPRPVRNYADLIWRHGYADAGELNGLISGWLGLYDLLEPDLLIVDHSPTALLAARSRQIRTATFGTGFFVPPEVSPCPSISMRGPITEVELVAAEHEVLETINRACEGQDGQPLSALGDLFQVDEDFLCTFPELDHYPQRLNGNYWGPRLDIQGGVEPHWPGATGTDPRVFVYLTHDHPATTLVLGALGRLGWPAVVHLRGKDGFSLPDCAGNIVLSREPVRMEAAMQQADLVVCHAGHGTVSAALLAGKPILFFPTQQEQWLLGQRLMAFGLAVQGDPAIGEAGIVDLMLQMHRDPDLAKLCGSFADKYADFDIQEQVSLIADRCEEITG